MSSFSVVLDACVLVPAVLRDTLLHTAAAGLYRPHWSEMILGEVERTLVEKLTISAAGAARLVTHLGAQFEEAAVSGYEDLIPAMTNHPKDRHVLAVAVAARAEVIVTSNLKDFPAKALAPHGIEAQSPDVFLTDLFDLNPRLVLDIVRKQAAALSRPPQPFGYVLDRLERFAPMFVRHLRAADREDSMV